MRCKSLMPSRAAPLGRFLKSSFPCPLPVAAAPTPVHNSQEWIRKEEKHVGVATKVPRVRIHSHWIRMGRICTCTCLHAGGVRVYSILPTEPGAVRRPGPGSRGRERGSPPRVVQRAPRHALACLCLLRRYIPSLCAVDRGLVGSGRFVRTGDRRVMCVVDWWSPPVSTAIRSMHVSTPSSRVDHTHPALPL